MRQRAMQTDFFSFLPNRHSDLVRKIRDQRAYLKQLEEELWSIEKAASAVGVDLSSSTVEEKRNPQPESATQPDKTMKEAAIEILSDYVGGLNTHDILVAMNRMLKTKYVRSSLSPQLSRLKAEGRIYRGNGVWILAKQNASADKSEPAAAPKDSDVEEEKSSTSPTQIERR